MNQILGYKDEKSDKFWRVETLGRELLTNWGRAGSNGRWHITGFDTEEQCVKEAEKLVASKRKKGYIEREDFHLNSQLYFDTEEYGLHPLTSHPVFRTYFSEEFYYDCVDEEAPFGNDEGSDTLWELQDICRKKQGKMIFAEFPKKMIEELWGLTYLPSVPHQSDQDLKALATTNIGEMPGEQLLWINDQVVLAVAFGQIKITGKLETACYELASHSLERMEQLNRVIRNVDEPWNSIRQMKYDLNRYVKTLEII